MRALFLVLCSLWTGCSFKVSRPCQTAGEAARETPFRGNKQCSQKKAPNGDWVNDGRYVEWYPSGEKALEGEYKMGKRHGKWFEYDESGKTTRERWFENGIESEAVRPPAKRAP